MNQADLMITRSSILSVTFFLLFKGVKSLYFTYSIMNFTVLNLQGITSLHLLTTRVGLLILLVTSFLTLQSRKVTVLLLLDRKLYCLKLTRDYVTTLTNYKGWITTKVG